MRTSAICRQWTVGVLGAIAACAVAVGATGCDPANLAGPTNPSLGPSSAPAAEPSSPTAAPASSNTGPGSSGAGCQAADLAYQAQYPGAAAGNYYDSVALVNRGSGGCQLAGLPSLFYTDGSGTVRPVPTVPETTGGAPYTVAPGGSVQFTIHTANGYGGFDSTSPQCAHPMTYRGLSVEVSGGRVPLGDVTIDVKCGDIMLLGWGAPTPH